MSQRKVHQNGALADQRAFFDDLITQQWETYINPAWDAARRYETDQLFQRVSPKTILDVGCGCGFHDLEMARKSGVERVLGIDYSAASIERAEAEYPHAAVSRQVADIRTLPAGDFDLVTSFQVIEHLQDPVAFLRACADQARPGGHIAIATPNIDRLENRLRRLFGLPAVFCDPQHFDEFNLADMTAIGQTAGVTLMDHFPVGISLFVPGVGRELIPRQWEMKLGEMMPGLARTFCAVFVKAGSAGGQV